MDHNFQDTIKIILFNLHRLENFHIEPGMRVAQIIFVPFIKPTLIQCQHIFSNSSFNGRQKMSFGSTGIF